MTANALSPMRIYLKTLFVILVGEVFIMYLLPMLLPAGVTPFVENISDGLLLTTLTSPILWLLIIRPLRSSSYQLHRMSALILKGAMSGIVSTDCKGKILSVNSAFENMLALPSDQLLGRQIESLFEGLVLSQNLHGFLFEQDFKHQDGTAAVFLIRMSHIEIDGRLRYVLFIDDISDRKELEKQIRAQEVKLVASSRLATLGEMAGGVAHEINSPLTTIRLLLGRIAEEMKEDIVDLEKVAELRLKADQTVTRIAKIISGLRHFARNGESDPVRPEKLSQIIDEAVGLCREKFHNHGVALEVSPIAEELTVDCRMVEIGQVIFNFLGNSYDAVIGSKDRWIHIDVKESEENVQIFITDSGLGIPSEIADKIFQPFFTTKEIGKGTGLGLSISMATIRSHYGTIRIDHDCPNTRFIIELPKKHKVSQKHPLGTGALVG